MTRVYTFAESSAMASALVLLGKPTSWDAAPVGARTAAGRVFVMIGDPLLSRLVRIKLTAGYESYWATTRPTR